MTKPEIYEQVVQLTSELHSVGVAEKIFSAAQTGVATDVEAVFESFKKENPKLHEKIVSFGEKFNKLLDGSETYFDGEIFGAEEDKGNGVTVFDTNTVDALSLYALTFFAHISELSLFDWGTASSDAFKTAIEEAGYEILADFIACYNWIDWVGEDEEEYTTLYDLLVDVLNDKFEETSEESEEET